MGQTTGHPLFAALRRIFTPAPGPIPGFIPGRGPAPAQRRPRHRRGFTLIEAALTTVIVGTGVLSIVAAQQAYHRKNDWSQKIGTAVLLANEVRELTLTLPMYDPLNGTAQLGPRSDQTSVATYDNVCDFAGTVTAGTGTGMTFSPPINALRQQIPNMAGWSQNISVTNVLTDNISSTLTQPLGSTDMIRVTVTINYTNPNNNQVSTLMTTSWVVGNQ